MKYLIILLLLASVAYSFDLDKYVEDLQKAKESLQVLESFYFSWERTKSTTETFSNEEVPIIEIDSGEYKYSNFV